MKGGISIPDWLAHTLIGWITGKTTKLTVSLVVIGSIIPDISKIDIIINWLGLNHQNFFYPIHTPIGAVLVGGIISLFFQDTKKMFVPLVIGIASHLILDFFLTYVSGGIKFLFPFSWDEWQYRLIYNDDYRITLCIVFTAVLIYRIYYYNDKRKMKMMQKNNPFQ